MPPSGRGSPVRQRQLPPRSQRPSALGRSPYEDVAGDSGKVQRPAEPLQPRCENAAFCFYICVRLFPVEASDASTWLSRLKKSSATSAISCCARWAARASRRSKAARVLVIGAGGLGSPVLVSGGGRRRHPRRRRRRPGFARQPAAPDRARHAPTSARRRCASAGDHGAPAQPARRGSRPIDARMVGR